MGGQVGAHKGQFGLPLPAFSVLLRIEHAETQGPFVGHAASAKADLGGPQIVQGTGIASKEHDAGHTNIASGHEGVRRIYSILTFPSVLMFNLILILPSVSSFTRSSDVPASSHVHGRRVALEIAIDHIGADEALCERRYLLEAAVETGGLLLGREGFGHWIEARGESGLQDNELWQARGILSKGMTKMGAEDRGIDLLFSGVKGEYEDIQERRRRRRSRGRGRHRRCVSHIL